MENIKRIILIIVIFFLAKLEAEPTVLLAILARNKEHTLERYLKCIERLDYPKSDIIVYINTNDNQDHTAEMLESWIEAQKPQYQKIIYEKHSKDLPFSYPHDWTPDRFHVLADIRNRSLKVAQEQHVDYYFVIDCDNFIQPFTLKTLMEKQKPIIAPMLRTIPDPYDLYSNFFYDVQENGYYSHDSQYNYILDRAYLGTFEVPVVHCTYLIEAAVLDQLNYIDGTNDYEFIIFSRIARKNGIRQYICNEEEFGVMVHFCHDVKGVEEKERLKWILKLPPL